MPPLATPTLQKIRTLPQLRSFERCGRRIGICTGCFDILQSGHAVFFEQCKEHCDVLVVVVGRSAPISALKPGRPINPENNRLYLVAALEAVDFAVLGDETYTGSKIDCVGVADAIRPDVYIVNDDDSGLEEKRTFCDERGIELKLVSRTVPEILTPTSSTAIIEQAKIAPSPPMSKAAGEGFPYRICLTGGWLDQPWVSGVLPGAVTVLNIFPDRDFAFRSGMATSTRETARKIWSQLPELAPEDAARILFAAENPPGSQYISGSQDALGLCLPGLSRLDYAGDYWPETIETLKDGATLRWLESVLHLVPIGERPPGYDPLIERHLTPETIAPLAASTEQAWEAIINQDVAQLGRAVSQTLDAWRIILPKTVPAELDPVLAAYDDYPGRTLSGCGGGYLIVIADCPVSDCFQIRIRY